MCTFTVTCLARTRELQLEGRHIGVCNTLISTHTPYETSEVIVTRELAGVQGIPVENCVIGLQNASVCHYESRDVH